MTADMLKETPCRQKFSLFPDTACMCTHHCLAAQNIQLLHTITNLTESFIPRSCTVNQYCIHIHICCSVSVGNVWNKVDYFLFTYFDKSSASLPYPSAWLLVYNVVCQSSPHIAMGTHNESSKILQHILKAFLVSQHLRLCWNLQLLLIPL